MKKYAFQVIAILGMFGAAHLARAEPYLAVMSGSKCINCHVNPTGGGKRNEFGMAFAQTTLSASPAEQIWDGRLNDFVAVGADFRGRARYVDIPDEESTFSFDFEEMLLYLELNVIKDKLTLYLDQHMGPGGAFAREAYALMWFRDKSMYLKAGRMFLPYGLRLEDDSAFIRQVPGINYTTPDDGIEGGLEWNSLSLNLAVSNGTAGATESDKEKQYSFRVSVTRPIWQLGASYNFNDVPDAERKMGNVFLGLKTGPISWLAEADYITDKGTATGERKSFVGLVEANAWIRQGHNIKLTYEHFDPDDEVDEDERNRSSLVWEYFPRPFLQLRLGVRHNEGIPQSNLQNFDEAFLQLHAYL